MRRIFADTGFFYAHAYANDRHHHESRTFLNHLSVPLITTDYVFDELITVLRYDFGHAIALRYGTLLKASRLCSISRITPEDETEAWHIFQHLADQNLSFTDCTSFAFMKRLGIQEAACFDAHFEMYGFTRLPFVPLKKKST